MIIHVTTAFSLAERSWLDSQVKYIQTCSQGLCSTLSLEGEREEKEVDLYQFVWQITLIIIISNMIMISNLSLEDTKKEFYYLKGIQQISWLPIQNSSRFSSRMIWNGALFNVGSSISTLYGKWYCGNDRS